MGVSIAKESPGLLTVTIQGWLTATQWQQSLNDIAGIMTPEVPTAVLILGESFEGWVPGGWESVFFNRQAERQVTKMALVADPKWEERSLIFAGEGLRNFQIKFFSVTNVAEARKWLSAPQ
jgi:hypothetical protein